VSSAPNSGASTILRTDVVNLLIEDEEANSRARAYRIEDRSTDGSVKVEF